MSKETYYIVQTASNRYVHGDSFRGFSDAWGKNHASLFCHYGKAERIAQTFKAKLGAGTPRRFPRIVKVTVETKTITPRR